MAAIWFKVKVVDDETGCKNDALHFQVDVVRKIDAKSEIKQAMISLKGMGKQGYVLFIVEGATKLEKTNSKISSLD